MWWAVNPAGKRQNRINLSKQINCWGLLGWWVYREDSEREWRVVAAASLILITTQRARHWHNNGSSLPLLFSLPKLTRQSDIRTSLSQREKLTRALTHSLSVVWGRALCYKRHVRNRDGRSMRAVTLPELAGAVTLWVFPTLWGYSLCLASLKKHLLIHSCLTYSLEAEKWQADNSNALGEVSGLVFSEAAAQY